MKKDLEKRAEQIAHIAFKDKNVVTCPIETCELHGTFYKCYFNGQDNCGIYLTDTKKDK